MSDIPSPLTAALEDRYAIERKVGEGGMAVVYLARDLKHNRSVALKVLKPELAAVVGAERFLAEIETTANLQHPHILPLYDSGQADSFLYYVMPYVEGETLRERLEGDKQLPVEEAVKIATAVASALDYAHRQGVVHRDIKPGNVLFQDGQPVVGDFGIALAVGAGGGTRLTETGLSLGTPYYMSPEQATGDQRVGPSSDIYSLGCVLYEMLVGSPPYLGATAQAILGQIITGKAKPVTEARPSAPANVEAAIRRALEKVAADRFRTASDFAAALSNPAFRHGVAAAGASAQEARRWKRAAVGLGVVATAFATALVASILQRGEQRGVSVYPLLPLTEDPTRSAAIISPDGSTFAYVRWTGSSSISSALTDSTEIWLRARDELDAMQVPGIADAAYAFFSPDSRRLAFAALDLDPDQGRLTSTIKILPLDGGAPVTVATLDFGLTGLTWGEEGYLYVTRALDDDAGVYRIAPEPGATAEPLPLPEALERPVGPVILLPGGRGLVGTRTDGDPWTDGEVFVLDLETQAHGVVGPGLGPGYTPSGHLLWIEPGAGLMAARFDLDALEVEGSGVPIVEDVLGFTLSDAGDLLYMRGGGAIQPYLDLAWMDRSGSAQALDWSFPLETGSASEFPHDPALSPDGTKLALVVPAEGDTLRILVRDLAGGTVTPLVERGGAQGRPAWSADSRVIGFAGHLEDGQVRLWTRRADGSGRPVALTGPVDPAENDLGRWAPDQPTILTGGPAGLNAVTPARDSTLISIFEPNSAFTNPTLSPNGRWVADVELVDGEPRVFVRPYPNLDAQRISISDGAGRQPQWSDDGQEIFYVRSEFPDVALWSARLTSADDPNVESRTRLFSFLGQLGDGWVYDYDSTGDRFLVLRIEVPTPVQGQVLVENFLEELRERVGG